VFFIFILTDITKMKQKTKRNRQMESKMRWIIHSWKEKKIQE